MNEHLIYPNDIKFVNLLFLACKEIYLKFCHFRPPVYRVFENYGENCKIKIHRSKMK